VLRIIIQNTFPVIFYYFYSDEVLFFDAVQTVDLKTLRKYIYTNLKYINFSTSVNYFFLLLLLLFLMN